jgi:succinate-acetate transporter protein
LIFVQVLEKLPESVVVEGKRVHRIDIELVVEIDPTVFQVIVAAAIRGWFLFTAFMVVAAFTDHWESSFICRLKRFIVNRQMG